MQTCFLAICQTYILVVILTFWLLCNEKFLIWLCDSFEQYLLLFFLQLWTLKYTFLVLQTVEPFSQGSSDVGTQIVRTWEEGEG